MADRIFEQLDEEECLELISPGGIGRIAYAGRFGPAGSSSPGITGRRVGPA